MEKEVNPDGEDEEGSIDQTTRRPRAAEPRPRRTARIAITASARPFHFQLAIHPLGPVASLLT